MKLEGFELDNLKFPLGQGPEHVELCRSKLEELGFYCNHQRRPLKGFKHGNYMI